MDKKDRIARVRTPSRRAFVVGAAMLAGSLIAGCSPEAPKGDAAESAGPQDPAESDPSPQGDESNFEASAAEKESDTLLVYFSRAGMNYTTAGPMHTDVGNTAVVAGYIQNAIGCDVYEITPVDPYPYEYEPTVEQNQREQAEGARPAIQGELPDLTPYSTIFVGSGVWHGNPPMIMRTFFESFEASATAGKTIVPFTTHAGSGLGSAVQAYRNLCPQATVSDNGLAVRGETARDSQDDVTAWLTALGQ